MVVTRKIDSLVLVTEVLTSLIIKLGHDLTLKIIISDDQTEFKLSPSDQCSTSPFGEIKFPLVSVS